MPNKFLTTLLGLERISGRMRKILSLLAKRSRIGILNPTVIAEKIHRTSLTCRYSLLDSLITGEALSTS